MHKPDDIRGLKLTLVSFAWRSPDKTYLDNIKWVTKSVPGVLDAHDLWVE